MVDAVKDETNKAIDKAADDAKKKVTDEVKKKGASG